MLRAHNTFLKAMTMNSVDIEKYAAPRRRGGYSKTLAKSLKPPLLQPPVLSQPLEKYATFQNLVQKLL
jgi:hypothetical protein